MKGSIWPLIIFAIILVIVLSCLIRAMVNAKKCKKSEYLNKIINDSSLQKAKPKDIKDEGVKHNNFTSALIIDVIFIFILLGARNFADYIVSLPFFIAIFYLPSYLLSAVMTTIYDNKYKRNDYNSISIYGNVLVAIFSLLLAFFIFGTTGFILLYILSHETDVNIVMVLVRLIVMLLLGALYMETWKKSIDNK